MKKVMRLVSVQLWALLGDMLSISNKQKKRPRLLCIVLLLFLALLGFVSFAYSFAIGSGLQLFHSLELLPAIMMTATSLVALFTTMLKIKGTVFGFRDYDMVMSLPVSTAGIVASRLLLLYSVNLIFTIVIMLPMMVAFGILAKPGAMFYLLGFVMLLFIPMLPIVIASVFGTVIAYITTKFRHSNFFSILFSLLLFIAIIVSPILLGNEGEKLVDISREMTNKVDRLYPLVRLYRSAMIEYDITAFALFLLISLFAFLIYSIIVKYIFKRVNTLIMTGKYRSNYRLGELKTYSPFKALFIKELKRYFSSTLYVLNTGFGMVILTLGAIAMGFVDIEKIIDVSQMGMPVGEFVPVFILFCIMMSSTSMASISLEGSNLWIVKSIPVSPITIYHSKIAVNLTILAPAVVDTIIIGLLLKLKWTLILIMLLVTIVSSIFIALYGLLMNLLLPNFKWNNEANVVKQSAASLVVVFSGMAVVGILAVLLMIFQSFTLTYIIYSVIMASADAFLYWLIHTYGTRRFYYLQY
ncbi:hypothetical protein H0486_14845 [Lachnospiraceae bacterium MD1]|uniref:Uncharacterized protein n=1 Tax=Variimorphobacter saccharofermentans TaxID=2755051 RepID=A0A839K2L9_9FIRM|nr:hypothetical protein [Variimorphobacter saccharofermentans]MBB2184155.1 hypothetical protein [Variimorphobacter saccharofermentans]